MKIRTYLDTNLKKQMEKEAKNLGMSLSQLASFLLEIFFSGTPSYLKDVLIGCEEIPRGDKIDFFFYVPEETVGKFDRHRGNLTKTSFFNQIWRSYLVKSQSPEALKKALGIGSDFKVPKGGKIRILLQGSREELEAIRRKIWNTRPEGIFPPKHLFQDRYKLEITERGKEELEKILQKYTTVRMVQL